MPTSADDQDSTPVQSAPRGSRWSSYGLRLGVALILVALIAVSYALGLQNVLWEYVRSNVDLLKAQAQEHLVPALLLFFLTYTTLTALSVPVAAPLSLVAGALFDRWLGTGVAILAATLGSTLAMLCSRYLFRDFVQRRFGDRLKALNDGVERDGAFYLFTLRLVPLFPFWLINLGMGLTRIRVWTFVWVSFLGMLPGAFLYVNAGTELSQINSLRDVLSPTLIISFTLLGVAPLLFRKLVQWWARR